MLGMLGRQEAHRPGTHLKAGGDEAGEGEQVDVWWESQAGPGGNLRGHSLGDDSSRGILVAWEGAPGGSTETPGVTPEVAPALLSSLATSFHLWGAGRER